LEPITFGFPTDEEQIELCGAHQMPQQLGPLRFRPVLALAAAAGMQRQQVGSRQLIVDRRSAGTEAQARDGVSVKYSEPLQWLKIDFRSVESGRLIHPMGTHNKLGARATPHVGLEDRVWIVQIGQDQIELGEVVCQVLSQLTAAREEAGQRARFDGLDPVHQAANQSQLRNVGVAQHFEVGLRKLPAQRGDCRQR
jgi:hypothetical protein